MENELGWKPVYNFDTGISQTIKWYLENNEWLNNILNGDYQDYYNRMYNK